MAKDKFSSPRIVLHLDEKAYDEAIRCNSKECVIARAIKKAYPHFSDISVSTATIRFSDRKAGVRYTYLPTEPALQVLLAFDQGRPLPYRELIFPRAAVITPIIRSAIVQTERHQEREARRDELETMEKSGQTLTPVEKRALSRIHNNALRERPDSPGKAEVKVDRKGVQVHGRAPLAGPEKANPNLLPSALRVGGVHMARGKATDDWIAFERKRIEAEIRQQILTEGITG